MKKENSKTSYILSGIINCCLVILTVAGLVGCGTKDQAGGKDGYMQITSQEAKKIMDTQEDYIILDVRTAQEYAEGHIAGAILIPDTEISERAEDELTDKDQLILVYCRSGRRSKNAAAELAAMGYTNVKEFGGILDWPYEIGKD
ncbi:MAG: rhodanese-like domain-containing protein [Lachnospiraceae bacterium]|nr:rhodanese-like domain-containing protein [Lachnospiraceae bacterium]